MLSLLDKLYLPLADQIAKQHKSNNPLFLGISGAQGAGKSTTATILCLILEHAHGLRCAHLSIDDLYLTKNEREKLAIEKHQLFITRGVPGTHDINLGLSIFDQVKEGKRVTLPKFDKLTDDRTTPDTWQICDPLDILIFEGWCVGCPPQEDIDKPINQLEINEDPQGIWRKHVNTCLKKEYSILFSKIDLLLMLTVPSMQKVREWRELQEQKLEQSYGRRSMSPSEVERFIMHYERLTRWMLQEMPHRADILIPVGDDHDPLDFFYNKLDTLVIFTSY